MFRKTSLPILASAAFLGSFVGVAHAQREADAAMPDAPSAVAAAAQADKKTPTVETADGPVQPSTGQPKQTKRILGIIPNFRAVSADEKLPPESVKDKFVACTEQSFDYSSIIFSGILAGVAQAENSVPPFHQGAAGYGRYYWHNFVDQTDENYWVQFILPAALHQDPRFYTLGHGGVLKRAGYAFTRIFVTRSDSGREVPNVSEIAGAGTAAGLSYLYYPRTEKTWTKTGQRWFLNVGIDGGTFLFQEFWPNINAALFHQKS